MQSTGRTWFGLKALAKRIVRHLPGYNRLMMFLLGRWASTPWIRRLPVAPVDVEVKLPTGPAWMVRPDRCEIAKQLFWTRGVREPREDSEALEWFSRRAGRSEVVFDIGCNSGLFSIAAAKANPSARVIAFDLLPEAVQICLQNVLRNDVALQVEVLLQGLGVPGEFRVPLDEFSTGMPTSVSTSWKYSRGVRIPIRAWDAWVDDIDAGRSVLAKIDVEATEHELFAHGQAFLGAHRPAMLCELLKRAQVDQFEPMLKSFGYRFWLVTDQGPRPQPSLVPHPRFKDWILLADGSEP